MLGCDRFWVHGREGSRGHTPSQRSPGSGDPRPAGPGLPALQARVGCQAAQPASLGAGRAPESSLGGLGGGRGQGQVSWAERLRVRPGEGGRGWSDWVGSACPLQLLAGQCGRLVNVGCQWLPEPVLGGDLSIGTPRPPRRIVHLPTEGEPVTVACERGGPVVSQTPLRVWQALGGWTETPNCGRLAAPVTDSVGVFLGIFGMPSGLCPPLPRVSPGRSWRMFACG